MTTPSSRLKLSFPSANLGFGASASVDISHSRVPLLSGFSGNVFFIPWREQDLNGTLTETLRNIDVASSHFLGKAELRFNLAREIVNEVAVGREVQTHRGPIEDGAEDQGEFSPATERGIINSRSEAPEDGRKKACYEHPFSGPRKSVTDPRVDRRAVLITCTSMDSPFSDIIRGLKELFNGMLPTNE